jgi:HEAT repeat protein
MSEPTHAADPHHSENHRAAAPPPGLTDLPPVEAPSAGFIVQLFVIPAVVVLVVVVVWLLFGKLAGGERDAMEYVRLIRASSSNLRTANRAAFELASLIQNDPKLASDPKLLGELTDLLDHDLDRAEDPRITQYVALALGRFHTLEAVAGNGQKVDPLAALAHALGAKYPEGVRIAAAASLAQHAARLNGRLDAPKAVDALNEAATRGDTALREMATYALGFFGRDADRVLRDRLDDEDRFVRYNAAVALARRGDDAALAILREMLSPNDLDKVIPIASAAERRAKIEAIELEALNALQTAVADGRSGPARSLRPSIEALTRSGLAGVRTSALALLKSLPAAP